MKRTIFLSISLIFLASCTHFEFYMAAPPVFDKGKFILIGFFERRSLSFDPFVVQNLRDSLGYELFKRGYPAEIVVPEGEAGKRKTGTMGKEEIKALCQQRGAALFIQGAVTEKEIGDFTDTNVSSLVSFQIHDATGNKIGEASVTISDTLSDVSVLKNIARRMAAKLDGVLSSK